MFIDRADAGRQLAKKVLQFKSQKPIVLGLPRGGVVVAKEIAEALQATLSVIVSRKLGAPHNPEFGIGAISEMNTLILDNDTIKQLGVVATEIEQTKNVEEQELARRVSLYRKNQPLPELKNKIVILVDDGLATGVTALAALTALKKCQPQKIVFAVPIASYESSTKVAALADEFVYISAPHELQSIGEYYQNFDQVSDEEVVSILSKYSYL